MRGQRRRRFHVCPDLGRMHLCRSPTCDLQGCKVLLGLGFEGTGLRPRAWAADNASVAASRAAILRFSESGRPYDVMRERRDEMGRFGGRGGDALAGCKGRSGVNSMQIQYVEVFEKI